VLKKTITYKDFNDQEVSEDFFFHLSKAELVELELSHEDGLSAALQRIVEAEDGKGIVQEFKNIILTAYGVRSADGKRFTKNAQIREEFEATEAYSELFMELVLDTDAAIEFINGIIPAGMAEEAAKLAAPELKAVEEEVKVLSTPVTVTKAEMQAMSQAELQALGAKLSKGEVKLAE
jgi:hypothetical protein